MRKIHYNYIKPQHYYNRLITFFSFVALSITLSLVGFSIESVEIFLLKLITIIFLLMALAVAIEYFQRGDYINPINIYHIEDFVREFLVDYKDGKIKENKYFNKYDMKTKSTFKKVFKKNKVHIISSIKRRGNTYTVTLLNVKKMAAYQVIRFLAGKGLVKIHIRRNEGKLKIIRID